MNQLPDLPFDLDFDVLAKATNDAFAKALQRFLSDLVQTSQKNQDQQSRQTVQLGDVTQLPSGTVDQLKAAVSPLYRASPDGRIVNVTDDVGGPGIAVSNAGKWLKLTLGAEIST